MQLVLVRLDSLFFVPHSHCESFFGSLRAGQCMRIHLFLAECLPVVLAVHAVFDKDSFHGGFHCLCNTVGTFAVFHEFADPLVSPILCRQVNAKCCPKLW